MGVHLRDETAICIWCNQVVLPDQTVEVIHVTEANALGIARGNCFDQLKAHLHKDEQPVEAPQEQYGGGYVPEWGQGGYE